MVRLLSGPLRVERLPNGRRRLLRELCLEGDGRLVRLPAGFETDYSSWPVFRWALAGLALLAAAVGWPWAALAALLSAALPSPRWSEIDLAGVVHDGAYYFGAWEPNGRPISRAEADRVWRIVARSGPSRASALGAWRGWAGLRLGGWPAWNRYRREDA